MDEALNNSSITGVSVRSLASLGPGPVSAANKDKLAEHRPHLWILLLPLILGVMSMSAFEYCSTLEVVRESHLSVFVEAAHNGVLALEEHLDSALVGSRSIQSHFSSANAPTIGTVAADKVFLDTLKVFPDVFVLVVGASDGSVSGAGRYPNATNFVFQVAPGTSCLKAYLVDEAQARHPSAFVTNCGYVLTDRPFYTAAATSAVGATQWTEAFADGVTGEIILSSAVRGATTGGTSFVAAGHLLTTEMSGSLSTGVPLVKDRFLGARVLVTDTNGRLLGGTYADVRSDMLKSASASSDPVTAEAGSVVITLNAIEAVKTPGNSWTESSWFGLAVASVKVGDGTTKPELLVSLAVPNDEYNPGRSSELIVFGVVITLLIALAVFGYCKDVKLHDADLGGGLSLLRVVSLVGSVFLIMGVYWVWTNTSVSTLDVAVRDLVVQVRGRIGTEVNFFMRQPVAMNELNVAAINRGEVDMSKLHTAAGAAALDKHLLASVRVFSTSRAPPEAALLGLDNGNLYGARVDNDVYSLMRVDASTNHLFKRVGITASDTRDESNVIGNIVQYNATARDWFILGQPSFSPVYEFESTRSLGITAANAFRDPATNLKGVWGSDVSLLHLQTLIRRASGGVSAGAALVAEGSTAHMLLIATSGGDVVVYNDVSNRVERVKAINSSNTVIRELASYMRSNTVDLTSAHLFTAGTGLDRLVATTIPLQVDLVSGRWVLVVALEQEAFQKVRRAWSSVSFVFAVPVVFITVMMSVVLYREDRSASQGAHDRRKHGLRGNSRRGTLWNAQQPPEKGTDASDADAPHKVSQRHHLRKVASGVAVQNRPVPSPHRPQHNPSPSGTEQPPPLSAAEMLRKKKAKSLWDYRENGCMHGLGDGVVGQEVGKCFQRLSAFVDDTCLQSTETKALLDAVKCPAELDDRLPAPDQTLIASAALLVGVDPSTDDIRTIPKRLIARALLGRNLVYQWFVIATQGPKAVRRVRIGSLLFKRWYKLTVGGVIGFHMLTGFWEAARYDKRVNQRPLLYGLQAAVLLFYIADCCLYWFAFCHEKNNMPNRGVHRAISGTLPAVRRIAYVRMLFTTAFVADFIVQVSTDYTTGPESVKAFLPYTSVLRPVFYAYRSTKMRLAVGNFVNSVMLSRRVLGLGVAFLAVCTVTSVALLEGSIEDTTVIGPTFGYIESFFSDIFVFTVTGENYPDVVYAASEQSDFFILYFMVLEVAGIFLLVSLLIAFFQRHFNKLYERTESVRKARGTVLRRMSILLAFRVLQVLDPDDHTYEAVRRGRVLRTENHAVWSSVRGNLVQDPAKSPWTPRGGQRSTTAGVSEAKAKPSSPRRSDASQPGRNDGGQADPAPPKLPPSKTPPPPSPQPTQGLKLVLDSPAPGRDAPSQLRSSFRVPGTLSSPAPDATSGAAPARESFAETKNPVRRDSGHQATHSGVMQEALHAIATHGGADAVSLPWFKHFFGAGVWESLTRRAAIEQQRLRIFRMDARVTMSLLLSRARKGCTHQYVRYMEHFVDRCKGGMHTDVSAVALGNSSVLEFLIITENLKKWQADDKAQAKQAETSTQGATPSAAKQRPRAQRARRAHTRKTVVAPIREHDIADGSPNGGQPEFGSIGMQSDGVTAQITAQRSSSLDSIALQAQHTAAAQRRCTCGDWRDPTNPVVKTLQRFFDNQMGVRYQVIIIPALVMYSCLMLLTASSRVRDRVLVWLPVCMFLFLLEIVLRVYAELGDYWTFHRLATNEGSLQGTFRSEALRFDIVVTCAACVGWVVWRTGNYDGVFVDSSDRIFLCLPALRLLSTVDNTRGLVFGLIGSLPSFYTITTLLLLIVYDYAIVGLWWFGGKLETVPSDVYSVGSGANFTTFFNSVALLFQLMVGESWNDVMVAAIYATHSLAPMWYFVSYIILLLLLLANVLTGIICDRFSDMEDEQDKFVHRQKLEHEEIKACAARIIQRLFYRVLATRVWGRKQKPSAAPIKFSASSAPGTSPRDSGSPYTANTSAAGTGAGAGAGAGARAGL